MPRALTDGHIRIAVDLRSDSQMKLGSLDFPSALINALRDYKLVVFAGAGVSMGEPACLPDFKTLAKQIAQGTRESPGEDEPVDRFLGRLRTDSRHAVRTRPSYTGICCGSFRAPHERASSRPISTFCSNRPQRTVLPTRSWKSSRLRRYRSGKSSMASSTYMAHSTGRKPWY